MIVFLFWTGMRPGVMKAMAWEDVDLVNGTVRVKYNINRIGQLKPPKTKAGIRTIELLPAALDILRQQREVSYMHMQPAREETVYLLHNKRGTEQRRRVFLSRDNLPYMRPEPFSAPGHWSGVLRKAKLAHREPYQLRHSDAPLMLKTGVHPTYLAKQLGHKDWGMIRKVYAKWVNNENPGYRNEIAEKLGQLDPHTTPMKKGLDKPL